jgi:YbbR domain-containing protein
MAIIKLSATEKRKLSIFFTCFILAVVAWLFFSLSNKYEYEVKTVVNFKNLPANKAFNPLQSDTVLLKIQGTGWQLLFTRLRIYPRDVRVDLKALEKRNFVTFNEQMNSINSYYSSVQKIISVQPDTLYFDFTTRKVKKVPIKLLSDLSFIKQFGQSKKTILKPGYVTLTGPQKELDKIEFWITDTLKRKSVESTISEKVNLVKSKEANISIYPTATEAKIMIEEFTEMDLTVPIRVINNKEYFNVKLVPDKVTITIMVSLTDFANVKVEDFEAIADLNLWKNDKANMLPVQIVKRRSFSRVRKIEPLQVNFIIKK